MKDDESVVFVRHSGDGFLGESWTQNWLFGEENTPPRIAIHYQDKASFDSSNYTNGPRRIRRFEEAASVPTIVVVAFSEKDSGEKYVTRTIPGTREIAVLDVWNEDIVCIKSVNEERVISEITEEYEDDEQYRIIKMLHVEDWKRVYQENNKLLWDWHSQIAVHEPSKNATQKTRYIQAVYHGDSKPLIKESLDNREQELIAEKYLRTKLEGFTIDVPRGMQDIGVDVITSNNNNDYLVQKWERFAEEDRLTFWLFDGRDTACGMFNQLDKQGRLYLDGGQFSTPANWSAKAINRKLWRSENNYRRTEISDIVHTVTGVLEGDDETLHNLFNDYYSNTS